MDNANVSSNAGGEGDVIADVRLLMYLYLPQAAWLQWAITVITGCPHAGQAPMFRKTPWFCLSMAVGMVAGGYALSACGMSLGWPGLGLLPVGWLFVTGGARALQTSIVHACVHAQFTGKRKTDMRIAEAITVALGIMNAFAYFNAHCGIHHAPRKVATVEDDDLAFLLLLGFQPGMSKEALWTLFWKTLVSPRFHYLFLRARVNSNFVYAPPGRIAAAVGWWAAVIAVVYLTNAWLVFVVAGLLPITLFYQIAALTQFLSEHFWLYDTDERGTVEHLSKKEQGIRSKRITPTRFFGEAPPAAGVGFGKWIGWWLRLLFIHLPLRIAVIPTPDLVWHSTHHDKTTTNFCNVDFEGLKWAENNPDFKPVWGLDNAIGLVFDTLSEKKPLSVNMASVNVSEALLGM